MRVRLQNPLGVDIRPAASVTARWLSRQAKGRLPCSGLTTVIAAVSALCSAVCMGPAHAFAYREHVRITVEAFRLACADLPLGKARRDAGVKRLCESELARMCFAHMVAIAGDHTGRPEKLLPDKTKEEEFLVKEIALDEKAPDGLTIAPDCRDVANLPTRNPDKFPEGWEDALMREGSKLVASTIARKIEYGNLASSNTQHFQPESIACWLAYLSLLEPSLLDGDAITLKTSLDCRGLRDGESILPVDLHSRFAIAAFSMHFLQDAFAAGHSGLKRQLREQEYAQAYHDDFNRTGRFFLRDGVEWYGYGDQQLDAETEYLPVEQFRGELGRAHLKAFLEDCGKEPKDSDRWNVDRLLTSILQQPSNPHERLVLSLQSEEKNTFGCSLIDACRKREIVIATETAAELDSRCAFTQKDVNTEREAKTCGATSCSGFTTWRFRETHIRVVEAAVVQMKVLLARLAGETSLQGGQRPQCEVPAALANALAANPDAMTVFCLFPARFRTIEKATIPYLKATGINQDSGALNFGRPRAMDEPTTEPTKTDPHPYKTTTLRAWTFGFDRKVARRNASMEPAFIFGLQTQEPEAPSEIKWLAERTRVGVMFEIVDQRGRMVNAGEAALYFTPVPPFGGVFRLAFKGAAGLDNVWQGSRNRYFYTSAGLSLSAHFGKNTAFIDVEVRNRSSAEAGRGPLSRLTFGYRGASIGLLQ